MFNNNGPIVPKMPDKTQGTYAETKAEIKARKRAQMAADAAMLAAREAEHGKKKSPWLTILTILFAAIALAAAGFAVYEYTENDKLKSELDAANKSYASASATIESLEKENTSLKTELTTLKKAQTSEDSVLLLSDSADSSSQK